MSEHFVSGCTETMTETLLRDGFCCVALVGPNNDWKKGDKICLETKKDRSIFNCVIIAVQNPDEGDKFSQTIVMLIDKQG